MTDAPIPSWTESCTFFYIEEDFLVYDDVNTEIAHFCGLGRGAPYYEGWSHVENGRCDTCDAKVPDRVAVLRGIVDL